MDLLLNFIVLILVSLLNLHWWIFVALFFAVPRLTGNLEVHPDDGIEFGHSVFVFFITLCAAFLYQWWVAKDVFGLQSVIAIFIMVATVQWATETIVRKNKTDTSSVGKETTGTAEQRLKPIRKGVIDQDRNVELAFVSSGGFLFRVIKKNGSYREFTTPASARRGAQTDSEAGYDVKIVAVGVQYGKPRTSGPRASKNNLGLVSSRETIATLEKQSTAKQEAEEKRAEKLYAKTWKELDEGKRDEGLWARLLAEHHGDEAKAKAEYLRTRVARLTVEKKSA